MAKVDVVAPGVFHAVADPPWRNTIGGHTPTPVLPVATICPDDTTCPKFDVPETFEVVMKVGPKFDVDATLRVVAKMNGIVAVSKLNTVFDIFEVNPAVNRFVVKTFVVVRAFDAYKFPVTLIPVTPVAGVTMTFEAFTFP
jgi:hypothetical protein